MYSDVYVELLYVCILVIWGRKRRLVIYNYNPLKTKYLLMFKLLTDFLAFFTYYNNMYLFAKCAQYYWLVLTNIVIYYNYMYVYFNNKYVYYEDCGSPMSTPNGNL